MICCAGYTLVELMMALALASLVALAGLAGFDSMAHLNSEELATTHRMAEAQRALRSVLREVRHAESIELIDPRLVLRRSDGSYLAYERTATADELHFAEGATQSAAVDALVTLGVSGFDPLAPPRNGIIEDTDYRSSAIVQGLTGIGWSAVSDVAGTASVGLKISFSVASATGVETVQGTAVSYELLEASHGY